MIFSCSKFSDYNVKMLIDSLLLIFTGISLTAIINIFARY